MPGTRLARLSIGAWISSVGVRHAEIQTRFVGVWLEAIPGMDSHPPMLQIRVRPNPGRTAPDYKPGLLTPEIMCFCKMNNYTTCRVG